MSIIHDALKKVQQSMQNKQTPSTPTNPEDVVEVLPSSSPAPSSVKEKGIPWRNLAIGLFAWVIVMVSGYFIYSQLHSKYPQKFPRIEFSFHPFKKQATTSSKPLAQIIIPAKKASVATHKATAKSAAIHPATPAAAISTTTPAPAPMATTSTSSPIILNVQGVMSSNGHNVALINNEVYEEGSVVNGQKIVKINLNTITVEHDGQEEVVSIKK
jgi:hypothetical protein